MRQTFFLFLLLISCKPVVSIDDGDINWIIGDWKRVDDKAGQRTFEHWQKNDDGSYQGFGYTLKSADTVFKEHLRFYKEDTWILEVTGVNELPVSFVMTELTSNNITVENPQHDFPTTIRYWKENDVLKAAVSNEEMQLDFSFIKQ